MLDLLGWRSSRSFRSPLGQPCQTHRCLSLEPVQQNVDVVALAGPPAPVLRAAVLEPGDAGADVGRMVLGVGDGNRLALAPHYPLHRLATADRTLVKALRHLAVGEEAAKADRFSEIGNVRNPQADGDRRHLEEFRQLRIGGAELAVVLGELAVFGAIAGDGLADDAHGRHIGYK